MFFNPGLGRKNLEILSELLTEDISKLWLKKKMRTVYNLFYCSKVCIEKERKQVLGTFPGC